MGARVGRVGVATLACLLWLSGCETSTKLGDLMQSKPASSDAPPAAASDAPPAASDADPKSTGSVLPPPGPLPDGVPKGLVGNDPQDDLNRGKKQFRAGNFGLAEQYFRHSVELHPRDLESWVGLAAAYDRLRRFDLADRAYDQATKIAGPNGELLNNRGYSYMLRGDYRHAHETLLQARALDPNNPYIKNNLELLEASFREGRAVQ